MLLVGSACGAVLAYAGYAGAREDLAALRHTVRAQGERIAALEGRLREEAAERRRLVAAPRPPLGVPVGRGGAPAPDLAVPEEASPARPGPGPTALSAPEQALVRRQLSRVEADRVAQAWAYRREAWLENPGAFTPEALNPLRARLGDDVYERYLRDRGRRTAVGVSGIAEASAAAEAGLRPGDRITHFDGRRVFHLNELLALSVQGESGTWVEVQARRGDQVLYLTLPRGPLGITGHRRPE